MNKWLVVATIAFAFFLGAPLMAQGGQGPGNGGGQGNGGNWGKNKDKAYRKDNPDKDRGDDWRKKAENEIGWGEDGTEERILPGDTVKDADKTTRLEAEADKLSLTDKKIRKEFIKYGKLGWDKAEKEDSRWAKEYKKVKDNPEALEKAKAEHKTKLDEAWADADESQIEKEVLTTEQLETFKTNTKDLREQTATDKSIKQDEIRARKVEELKKRAEDWAKSNNKGSGEENEVKKEKKEGEDTKEEEKK